MGTEYKVQSAECKVQFLSALFFSVSSRGQNAPHKNIRFCGGPAPQDNKENSEYQKPAHDIFALQDMWQTNKINIKHVPNPNHRLD